MEVQPCCLLGCFPFSLPISGSCLFLKRTLLQPLLYFQLKIPKLTFSSAHQSLYLKMELLPLSTHDLTVERSQASAMVMGDLDAGSPAPAPAPAPCPSRGVLARISS